MNGYLLVLLALGALLLFILWEMWANRRSALKRRAAAADGFLPGAAAREAALFVLAAVFLACSVLVLASPDLAISGRHAYLFRILRSWFGTLAAPVLFLAVGVGVFVAGISARRRRLASEGDRGAG
jgi:hypothetical protein